MSVLAKARRFLYSFRRTIGVRNPWQAAVYATQRTSLALGRPMGRARYALEPRHIPHPFDREFGVRTSGLIEGDGARFAYYGVSPSIFRRVCDEWRAGSEAALEAYTFIDLGCGMGRALLLASELPFRKVVGVEFKSGLAHGARQNAAAWIAAGRARCPIEVVGQDALDFAFPDGPLLIFLYNPFGEDLLRRVLDRLVSARASIDVLYLYPVFGFLLEQDRRFQRLWMKLLPLDARDAAADAFGSTSETCAAYRLKPAARASSASR